MKSREEQQKFFDAAWPRLKEALERGGVDAALIHMATHGDDEERRVLYRFARRGVVLGDWQGKSLSAAIPVAEAGVTELLRQAEAAADAETRRARIDEANIISFNLASDLADCWPGDDEDRERSHFEAGLKAADRCIRWRQELGKPGAPRSMAWWLKGMHQLSLGDGSGAVDSFSRALDDAKDAVETEGQSTDIVPEGGFLVILIAGYLGLARWITGDESGQELYADAIAAFRGQLERQALRDDAQFGIDQLEKVRLKYAERKTDPKRRSTGATI